MTEPTETFCALSTVWNVTALNALLDRHAVTPQPGCAVRRLRVADVRRAAIGHVDPARLAALPDPDRALILVTVTTASGGSAGHLLVDGHHRLVRAARQGRQHVDVFVLDAPLERAFRL